MALLSPDRDAVMSWPLTQAITLGTGAAIGAAPAGFAPVTASPLIVLVGLTGAGKSTLAHGLVEAGRARLTPDRRRLTDAVILGDSGRALDRAGRFAATARFRKLAPGGMGEILAALSVRDHGGPPFLFDGLRGAAELSFFAPKAPRALFLVLKAADETRARRIAGRGDGFDGAASGSDAGALALVVEEAAHYRLDDALDALRRHAPGRFHALDAEEGAPSDILAEAIDLIDKAGF